MSDQERQKIINKFEQLGDKRDVDEAHRQADNLMCEVLTILGEQQIVDAYKSIHKWYI